ncbi:MAG: hypothetical protein J0H82_14405 [Alphaproteobacteria bacterium]|jgi:hypothetical protein|nr:hypothetical protein [Alphaproteobacteria bacterium]
MLFGAWPSGRAREATPMNVARSSVLAVTICGLLLLLAFQAWPETISSPGAVAANALPGAGPAGLGALLMLILAHGAVRRSRRVSPSRWRSWTRGRQRSRIGTRRPIYGARRPRRGRLTEATASGERRRLQAMMAALDGLADEIEAPSRHVADNLRYLQGCADDLLALARMGREADVEALADDIPATIDQSLEAVARIIQVGQAIGEVVAPAAREGGALDLNQVIRAAVTATGRHWRYAAQVDLDLDPRLPPLRGDLGDLRRLLIVVITRTAQVIDRRGAPELGQIRISTGVTGEMVELSIADSGAAMQGWDAVLRSAEIVRLGGQVEVDAAAGAVLRILLPLQKAGAMMAT